jgi:hypothetical protein
MQPLCSTLAAPCCAETPVPIRIIGRIKSGLFLFITELSRIRRKSELYPLLLSSSFVPKTGTNGGETGKNLKMEYSVDSQGDL